MIKILDIVKRFGKLKKMTEKNWNGMEWFGRLEKLKKLKKYNEMKWVK